MNINHVEIKTLEKRSEMNETIRSFFKKNNYLEVETPTLSQFATVDLNIDSFKTSENSTQFFLTTSPEFHMKRLLSFYKTSIFQICKAFRMYEDGKYHNCEFTILEFYKINADEFELMKEIEELISRLIPEISYTYLSYIEIFKLFTDLNPIDATIIELEEYCKKKSFNSTNRDELIDFIWIYDIEPNLSMYDALFIYDYPASQSSLAKLKNEDKRFAQRFELYLKGIEIANGFNELTDAKEQEIRFIIDQQKRTQKGKENFPFDKFLIEAMSKGMPNSSGVAIGLDRLLMILMNKSDIKEVLPFTKKNA